MREKISNEVTECLKLRRFKLKLSQDSVANLLGISRNSYNYYENHPLCMSIDMILMLNALLKINLFKIFYSKCCKKQQ